MKSFGIFATIAVACALVASPACSSSTATDGDGGTTSPDGALPADDAATFADGATNDGATNDGGALASGLRVSSETRGTTRGTARAFGTETAQRCPAGSLVVGLEAIVANDVALLCAPVAADGSLGTEIRVASGSTLSGEPTTLRCPSGEVAVRLVGAYDGRDFTGIGLRCAKPGAVVDGGSAGAGNASVPALFGASTPNAFDDACPNGSALSGLAYFSYSDGDGNPAGFGTATPLCRRVLEKKSPSGIPLEAGRPFALGAATTSPPVRLVSTASTPTGAPSSTLDCPSGSVVAAIDGGASMRGGPSAIAELQLVCRPLAADATLGTETAKGRGIANALVARCLEGHAIREVRFVVMTLNAGIPVDLPRYGIPTCALPDAVDTTTPEQALPAVFPQAADPRDVTPTLTVACPAGKVLTGIDQWITNDDDGNPSTLHHVAAHCRPIAR